MVVFGTLEAPFFFVFFKSIFHFFNKCVCVFFFLLAGASSLPPDHSTALHRGCREHLRVSKVENAHRIVDSSSSSGACVRAECSQVLLFPLWFSGIYRAPFCFCFVFDDSVSF